MKCAYSLITCTTVKGAIVTFLLRSPAIFDHDASMQPYIQQGTARLVQGDALKKEDVQRGWEEAAKPEVRDADADSRGVDAVLLMLGLYNPAGCSQS